MPAPSRILIVEYLRGLAALAVAWFHLTNTYAEGWVRSSGAYGWLGVEVFFVISGFVIPFSLSRVPRNYAISQFPRFMLRRLMRLEPPYLVSIVLALLLWNLAVMVPGFRGAPPPNDPVQVAAHLLYLVPLTGHDWLQPVYWTLAYEFVFYILVGLLFPVFGTPAAGLRWAVLAIAVAAGAYLDLLSVLSLLFVMGICAFRLICYAAVSDHRSGSHAPSARMDLWISVCVLMLTVLVMWRKDTTVAYVGLATTIIILVFRSAALQGRIGQALVWLGAISYSLYLTHVPIGGRVVNIGRRFVDGPVQELLLSILALCVCLAFAAMFHALCEKPAIDWARRAAGRRRGAHPIESGVTP